MTALTAKANISGSPSRATANAGFGALHDFISERLNGGGATEAELAATRASLKAARDLQPITASVGSNALTITLNPTNLDFRSATLGSGTVNTRNVPAAISVVVSSGSTLGTANGVAARLAVLAIDNAGTVELAVVNMAGLASYLDESTLISTTAEGGAGGADTAGTIYSTSARSNVAFRVVGYIECTQATAGTWATAPSKIQGAGGLLGPLDGGRSELFAAVTLTNQTSVDFTNIPADVNEIVMTLAAGSTNGTANMLVQLIASSVETSGYTGGVSNTSPAITNNSTGFIVNNNVAAANITSATIFLTRHSGNTWACASSAFAISTRSYIGSGEKTLSGPLTGVRLTTAGSDQYDAGTVSVLVRRG